MIKREHIQKYSLEILDLLKKERIDSIEGIQKRVGESFNLSAGILQIEARPSGRSIMPTDIAMTMSYIVQGTGIPVELRFNKNSSYAHLIIKCDRIREGYNPLSRDIIGNQIQSKRFEFSFERAIEELEDLAK